MRDLKREGHHHTANPNPWDNSERNSPTITKFSVKLSGKRIKCYLAAYC